MKAVKSLLFAALLVPANIFAATKDTSVSAPFYRAKDHIEAMLSGKEPMSYEKAIYEIENAWYGGAIAYNEFDAVINYHVANIKMIAASRNTQHDFKSDLSKTREEKKREYENAINNYSIYSYMTDTVYKIKADNIYYYFHQKPYSYSNSDPLGTSNWENTQVVNLLETRYGNCFALASLYKIFSEKLNSEAQLCTAPGHIYISHADEKGTPYNIELSSRSFPGSGTIETITYTPNEAVSNGIALREMDIKQSVVLCLVYLAKGYEYKLRLKDDFMLSCAEEALKYDDHNLNAMLLKAELLENKLIEQKKDFEILKKQKDFSEYQEWVTHIYNLGYREMPYDMKNILIKGWTRDTIISLSMKDNTPQRLNSKGLKDTRYAGLSWGLFDEEIKTKPIERFGNTAFDTKKKYIIGFLNGDVLYNQYTFDPVIFAWNVDPLAHKLPGWSPYAFCKDNPVMNVDPDGAFPYTFHVRAFAPPNVFKPTDFHDDGRGYSTSTNVTSRIKQNFTIDPTARTYSGGKPTSDPTIWHGNSKTAHDFGGISKPEFGKNSLGSSTAAVTSDFQGSNPFFYGAAPNIHVSSAISITENLKAHTLSVSIDLSSKQFPATEAFIQDATGHAVFLGGAPAIGDPSDLMTRDMKEVSTLDLTIGINDKGEFQNVTAGNKTYSLDEYNKQATAKPAVQQEEKK